MCFNTQCQIINLRIDFRSASLELSFCIFSLCSLFSVSCKRVLLLVFFLGKGEKNNKRCFYYNETVKILSLLFRLGRGTSQQSKYLAAYLSREVSSWQCDTRRYENNFHPCYSQAKGIFIYSAVNTTLLFKITVWLAVYYFSSAQSDTVSYCVFFHLVTSSF